MRTIFRKIARNPAAGLIEDELAFRGINSATAARAMQIPRSRLCDIFAGRKGVSSDTALRIQRYIGVPAAFLIEMQAKYDLHKAGNETWKEIEAQIQPFCPLPERADKEQKLRRPAKVHRKSRPLAETLS